MKPTILTIGRNAWRRQRGMTLMEVMMASALSFVVVCGAMWLLTSGMRSAWKTTEVTTNDLTHWGLTNRLILDTRVANSLCVYSDLDSALIATEGSNGIAFYADRRVGNLLVLSQSLPDRLTGGYACHKLTGYRYVPSEEALYKFEHSASAADIADNKSATQLLLENVTTFRLTKIAEHIALPAIGAQTAGAFYWDRSMDSISARTAVLRFELGDKKQHRRVRNSRLVEVSFYVRP
jgi:prepilin-type N-terminal cleavage/methylation domain-containing protein